MKPTPNSVLIGLTKALSPVQLQNRLMRSGDREIAMAMLYMEDADRERIIGSLGAGKGRRVREELSFQRHVRITYELYRAAVDTLVSTLNRENGSAALRSYIRPTDRRQS